MTGGRRMRPLAIAGNTLALWGTVIIASVALWPIYEDVALILLVVVSLVVGTAIAIVGALYRWSFSTVLFVSIGAFLGIGVPLAVPQESIAGILPTLEGMRQLIFGVPLGWKQLLTITLPVGTYQALLVPALILVFGTTVVSLTVAVRSRRGDLAAIGPILLYLAATALGPTENAWPVLVTLALISTILLWLMGRRLSARRDSIQQLRETPVRDAPLTHVQSSHRMVGVRTVLSATLIFAIAGIAGVAAVTAAPPTGDKLVLRDNIEQPFDPRDYVSPLAGFRKYLSEPEAGTVLLSVAGLETGDRVRIATLDTYNGVVYSVGAATDSSASGSFTRVPFRFDQSQRDGRTAQIEITIGEWESVWLPTIGHLSEVEFTGPRASALRDSFYYNNTTGTAAVIDSVREGDAFTLTTVVGQQRSANQLTDVTPGAEILPSPQIPEELDRVLTRYTSGSSEPGEKLVRMLNGLASDGYISHGISDAEPPSRSGHSSDRITQLLSDQLMIGDGEQYAVAAAIMARQIGFPSRVVFGFQPEIVSGEATLVRGDSVSAWIEVSTEEFGWVAVDATPVERPIPDEEPEQPTVVSRPQPVIPPPLEEVNNRVDITQLENNQDDPNELEPWLAVLLGIATVAAWVIAVAAILVSPFVAIIALKLRRRKLRQRASTPLSKIHGGWQEYRDAVVDHGVVVPEHSTRREVAAIAGGARSTVLAAVTDRAVFAPHEVSESDADKVWRAVTELRLGLDSGLTRWQRLSARVSLRSFRKRGPARASQRKETSGEV